MRQQALVKHGTALQTATHFSCERLGSLGQPLNSALRPKPTYACPSAARRELEMPYASARRMRR